MNNNQSLTFEIPALEANFKDMEAPHIDLGSG